MSAQARPPLLVGSGGFLWIRANESIGNLFWRPRFHFTTLCHRGFPYLCDCSKRNRSMWSEEGGTRCAVHIAETDGQKFSRPCTVATVRTVTVDVPTAALASALRRNRFVGAASSSSGQGRSQTGKAGEDRGPPRYERGVRSSYAELTSRNPEYGVTWTTSCRHDSSDD